MTANTQTSGIDYRELPAVPVLMDEYKNAVRDLLPVVGTQHVARRDPQSAFVVRGVKISPAHLAAYVSTTGLTLENDVPVTYPYVLSFPIVMKLMTSADFPLNAVGLVHLTNVIEQKRPVTVDDVIDFHVHAENLRPHTKGALIDVITTATVDGDVVWNQTSTFLAKGTKLVKGSDAAKKPATDGRILEPIAFDEYEDTPTSRHRVTASLIGEYAEASGDKNPIHVSGIGAKAFGFPGVIAHGMWSAAAILGDLEGVLPKALRYSIEFAKPVALPATVASFVTSSGDNAYPTPSAWNIQLRKASNLRTLHASARIEAL